MLKKLSILVFAAVAALTLVACSEESNVEGYYVAIDINPSIEFIVDEENNVESFIFLNEDAAVLCADLDFTGMNIDDAVELFVQTATEAGYVDPEGDDNAVLVTVIGEENQDEQVEEVKERLRNRLNRHFAKKFINALVITEDFTHEDLVAQADELGVSPGKLKLSLAAQAGDETLVLEELLEMPVKDIMSLMRDLHGDEFQEFKAEKREEFQARKDELIEKHKERLQEYIENHPELTEEEIEELVQKAKRHARREARDRWQERKDEWQQRRDQEVPETPEDTTDNNEA